MGLMQQPPLIQQPSYFDRNAAWAKKQESYQTPLSEENEIRFNNWLALNKNRLGEFDPKNTKEDYDMRGWWLENNGANAPDGHFPDTHKTPYHETFSNESKYSTETAPKWVQSGSAWMLIDREGNILKKEEGQPEEQPQPENQDTAPAKAQGLMARKNVDAPVNTSEKMYYGYRVRDKLYPGEDEYFRNNPSVAGMAAEDGNIIFNPYAKNVNFDAVGKNEAARLWMRENKVVPDFDVTDEQRAAFRGTAYENNENALKQTISARVISGDPSAGAITPSQQAWSDQLINNLSNQQTP